MLRVVERQWRNFQSRAAEAGGTDRDQQGSRRFPACCEIVEALSNQVAARKRVEIPHTRNYTVEQAGAESRLAIGPRRCATDAWDAPRRRSALALPVAARVSFRLRNMEDGA